MKNEQTNLHRKCPCGSNKKARWCCEPDVDNSPYSFIPKNRRLVSASAFYHNDVPGGVGIHYPKPWKTFKQDVDKLMANWDQNTTPERIHDQLREIGEYLRFNPTLSDDTSLVAFVDIVWLESRGHLKIDNFNGGLWMWEG